MDGPGGSRKPVTGGRAMPVPCCSRGWSGTEEKNRIPFPWLLASASLFLKKSVLFQPVLPKQDYAKPQDKYAYLSGT